MSIGEQLQDCIDGVDQFYRGKFIAKTKRLLDARVTETHTFLDASLAFMGGHAVWRQDLPILNHKKPISTTNPLIKPEIPVASTEHAYNLFREYYVGSLFGKKGAYERGIDDLERYCKD